MKIYRKKNIIKLAKIQVWYKVLSLNIWSNVKICYIYLSKYFMSDLYNAWS